MKTINYYACVCINDRMPRLRAVIAGCITAGALTLQIFDPIIAFGTGLCVMLLVDLPFNAVEKKRLRISHATQVRNLQQANIQIHHLAHRIELQAGQLTGALSELERRDSVGAPEARNLIESQRATLAVQAKAMEEAKLLIRAQEEMMARIDQRVVDEKSNWEHTIRTLEKVLEAQAEQARIAQQSLQDEKSQLSSAVAESSHEMQKSMTQLLERLATEPRTSNVSVQDSVVMQSNQSPEGTGLGELVQLEVKPVPPRKRVVKPRSGRNPNPLPIKLVARPLQVSERDWVEAFNEDLV